MPAKETKDKSGNRGAGAEIERIFTKELGLNDFEKALVRERFLGPHLSCREIGEKYGLKSSTIETHFKKQRVKDALTRLNADLFGQIQALSYEAAKHYKELLQTVPDVKDFTGRNLKYFAAKDLLGASLKAPAALPESKPDVPEFFDPSEG